jgi:hypothetical protein
MPLNIALDNSVELTLSPRSDWLRAALSFGTFLFAVEKKSTLEQETNYQLENTRP